MRSKRPTVSSFAGMRLLGIAVVLTLGTGCSSLAGEDAPFVEAAQAPAPGESAFQTAFLQATGVEFAEGHEVRLVNNGQLFDEMVELIAQARSSVHVVVFIWRPGEPSNRLLRALAQRREGVACRVVADSLGSTSAFEEEVLPALQRIGCEARIFRPLEEVPQRERLARNHRKLFIVDGKTGITGGFGIWRSWLGDGVSHEDAWRETNAWVHGPAVRQMQLAFADDWQVAGGSLLPPEAFPEPCETKGAARAAFSASEPGPGDTEADRLTQLLIASATERVWIANAYFVPSEAILSLLEEKRRAGVDVRVLAAGPVHDWKVVLEAQRATYPRLLEAGVRLWEYQPSMMHAKTLLVDDRLAVVGSTNMDALSLNRLEEGSLVVDDRAFATTLAQTFLEDLEHSKEIAEGDAERETPWQRFSRGVTRLLKRFP
jgi:cardiolipin synthase